MGAFPWVGFLFTFMVSPATHPTEWGGSGPAAVHWTREGGWERGRQLETHLQWSALALQIKGVEEEEGSKLVFQIVTRKGRPRRNDVKGKRTCDP